MIAVSTLRLCPRIGCQKFTPLWNISRGISHPPKHNLTTGFVRCLTTKKTEENGGFSVYEGPLSSRIKAVKIFSLSTSIAGLAAQPIVIEQASKIGGTFMVVLMSGFVGFFTFVTPFLLHWITKKYVTVLKYNPPTEEYTARTISFFLLPTYTKFKVSDVRVPDVPGMFTSFHVGKKAFFVDPRQFPDTSHYVKIMGYDKPIDFKLELIENHPKDDATSKKDHKP
ncbi:transmembrane protein 70 homolog, mitochondrial [Lutzomyia longipalpis]|nr:transmembrane protein 70 homolog, mitochondrial [Lutzomyia longipalpis]